jgi:DNA-binding NarL/FixJ family response regulator
MTPAQLHPTAPDVGDTAIGGVVLVASDSMTRRQLATALTTAGIDIVAQAPDERALATTVPDVLVVADDLSGPAAAKIVKRLRDTAPGARIVSVASTLGAREVKRSLQAGVDGLVREDDIDSALAATVLAVRAGQVVVPRETRAQVTATALSQRERQILGMVVMGFSNGEIARRLFLAESTIKSHLSSAFSKLGVSSRNEATAAILDPAGGLGPGILAINDASEAPDRSGGYSAPRLDETASRA